MERHRIAELHYITHLSNVASICRHGVVCHETAADLQHVSVASADVQDRRSQVVVPRGLALHRYSNLYFNARNAMMYTLVKKMPPQSLAVVALNPDPAPGDVPGLFDLPNVVITSQNAASNPRWLPSPDGLAELDEASVFRRDWNHADPKVKERYRQAMQAEVLVPELVDAVYVQGVYVTSAATRAALVGAGVHVPVTINTDLFFGYVSR